MSDIMRIVRERGHIAWDQVPDTIRQGAMQMATRLAAGMKTAWPGIHLKELPNVLKRSRNPGLTFLRKADPEGGWTAADAARLWDMFELEPSPCAEDVVGGFVALASSMIAAGIEHGLFPEFYN